MAKHKSSGKDKGKDAQLVIRIDKAEREAFVTICEQLDTSAAREIRRFMREFVASQASQTPAAVPERLTSAEPAQAGPDAPAEAAPVDDAAMTDPDKPKKSARRALR